MNLYCVQLFIDSMRKILFMYKAEGIEKNHKTKERKIKQKKAKILLHWLYCVLNSKFQKIY